MDKVHFLKSAAPHRADEVLYQASFGWLRTFLVASLRL